jgi:hypothetical protein
LCALARGAEILGERWTLLLVRELLLGPKRFSDLLDRLDGISPSVLTERLQRALEANKAVVRRWYAEMWNRWDLDVVDTHAGELFGIAPTRRRIEYAGAAFFRLADRRVVEGWVLGDTAGLRAQLSGGRAPGDRRG